MRYGIFNETFDTVLFKAADREQQMYRFAAELVYCVFNNDRIMLPEPHATDQIYLMRLQEEGRELENLMNYFRAVRKPGDLPLAGSLAVNLLNPNYDFSSLSDPLESVRRARVGAVGELPEPERRTAALEVLRELADSSEVEGDDEWALAYWIRLLRGDLHAETNEPAKVSWTMGEKVLRGIRDGHVRYPGMESEVRRHVGELTGNAALQDEDVERYFGARSKFYQDRDQWLQRIDPERFDYLKEVLDSVYNVLINRTCNTERSVFMPGEPDKEDQQFAQRTVSKLTREEEEMVREPFGLLYATSPRTFEWRDVMDLANSLHEALKDDDFRSGLQEFQTRLSVQERQAAIEGLARLVSEQFLAGTGIAVEVSGDRKLVLTVKEVALEVRSEVDETTYGTDNVHAAQAR